LSGSLLDFSGTQVKGLTPLHTEKRGMTLGERNTCGCRSTRYLLHQHGRAQ